MLEPKGIKPIVGGNAVAFYTNQGYETRDLDLVCRRKEEVANALSELQFEREGRHWFREDMALAVVIPSDFLTGDENKISTINVDSMKAYILGIEDTILD